MSRSLPNDCRRCSSWSAMLTRSTLAGEDVVAVVAVVAVNSVLPRRLVRLAGLVQMLREAVVAAVEGQGQRAGDDAGRTDVDGRLGLPSQFVPGDEAVPAGRNVAQRV